MPLFEGGTHVPQTNRPAIKVNLYDVTVHTENRPYGVFMLMCPRNLYSSGRTFDKALKINKEVLRKSRAGEAQRDKVRALYRRNTNKRRQSDDEEAAGGNCSVGGMCLENDS